VSARVFRSLAEAHGQFGPASLAIGNFDGVHVGHRALIAAVSECATANSLRPSVLTFHPHPTVLVAPDRVPPMLCSLDERIQKLEELGVEKILVLPFTPELSRFTPEQFVAQVLVDTLNTKATFVGDNFHFGYRQSGTPEVLTELGRQYGFATTFLKPITYQGKVISSSSIRSALVDHRLLFASRLMSRCFSVAGPVVTGQGIGTRQTVPTLNILPVPGQLVLRGVYITKTFEQASGRHWPSITNVGVRPTFQGEGVTIESYLLAPLSGESPRDIRVEFRRFVRQERAFENPEDLKHQIMRDVSRAQAYWRRVSKLA
jgi:riboflavin kinase/FMN adenylyltransferase